MLLPKTKKKKLIVKCPITVVKTNVSNNFRTCLLFYKRQKDGWVTSKPIPLCKLNKSQNTLLLPCQLVLGNVIICGTIMHACIFTFANTSQQLEMTSSKKAIGDIFMHVSVNLCRNSQRTLVIDHFMLASKTETANFNVRHLNSFRKV